MKERLVLIITQDSRGSLSAQLLAVDHELTNKLDPITFERGTLRFSLPSYGATFEGALTPNAQAIRGIWKWSPDGAGIPLQLDRATAKTSWAVDHTIHKATLITVEPGIRLEVLDWGGSGRPLVLLSGLGDTAHVFDVIAPKLATKYHVYGITRRGFGASDSPPMLWQNYASDRLGDDVLSVINQLKLNHPVLLGHSIAGEELSSIGSRHPESVAGLIYLEAGYPYALYVHSPNSIAVSWSAMRQKVDAISDATTPQEKKRLIHEMLNTDLPAYGESLKQMSAALETVPDQNPPSAETLQSRMFQATQAVHDGAQIYTKITCPLLAIFNEPSPPIVETDSDAKAKDKAARFAVNLKGLREQEDAFRALGQNAHVILIKDANHYIFRSNEAEVIHDIDTFIATLP
ncbi:alpha/beta fold hydrolase [Silvibacterium acidisoli]|uniref:alpha/beta fold hydrolase n=1 Tax=Acidobacteriaceae bacterium ZG23-2 TaxID=2883246 RepID=UPI00406C2B36